MNLKDLNIRQVEIHGKRIYITDHHQQVLLPWYLEYVNQEYKSFELFTFDYHSDTIFPFSRYAYDVLEDRRLHEAFKKDKINKVKSKLSVDSIKKLISNIRNDEFILAALELDIINRFTSMNFSPHTHPRNIGVEHKPRTICSCNYFPPGKHCEFDEVLCKYCIPRLDDNFMNSYKFDLPSKPYILDIDLDYFQTINNFKYKELTYFKNLVVNSSFLTIAKSESNFTLTVNDETTTIDDVEKALLEIIDIALSD